ncbi:S24 family peptidase [Xanthomonas oryzae pv. oryzicola]|uniref:S24 family peptidase n=1 Tax=Xanthomonas oryzae TaxID=347 RepID=UPI000406F88B|nr:S24 family peptidase [Xanthomonas oryzae]AJQ86221.1 peptidase S24 [Xanthomonas oryzae pv. oryzicola]AKO06000.1 peptidase S24 [Xanthomonas oryzae pv. oryzicola]AKO09914.1 peptidase S24 [Xanthomonas oryzae pv. oryzicola]OWB24501.1 peptidase S24 [Xanthomonas oryzae pv. oryzicola]OWB32878.1 peptidase S24 [Xanthomonas oryzae pv. oryzicola]
MDIAAIRLNNLRLVIDHLIEQGCRTRKDQAQRLGDFMSSSYLSQLLSGKPIGNEVARKISLVMERDAGWMDRPHTPIQEANSTVLAPEITPGYLRLELYEGAAGMGTGVVNQDFPEVIRTLEVAEWEVRRKLGFLPKPGRIQLITGRGPSMRPKIEDGDVVWIDTAVDYFDGDDYYLINVDGETSIKMLQRRSDGIYVVSVNPEFPAWKPEAGALRIKGRALIHAGFRRF